MEVAALRLDRLPRLTGILFLPLRDDVKVSLDFEKVLEDQWKTQLAQGTDARVPKDRFFLLRLSVVNAGSTDVLVPGLTLVDDSGQSYQEMSNGDQVPQWMGYLRRAKPTETLQGNVVFDVPPKHYRLRVSDETSQKSRDIDIPLNFTSDSPDMPTQQ